MTKFIANRTSDLSAENSVFKLQGISGSAPTGCTTHIDWQFPEERWVQGAILYVKDGHWGDKIDVSLVSKVGGVTTVLNTSVEDFSVRPDSIYQYALDTPYVALVAQGLYLRISYTNVSLLQAAQVSMHLLTHIPADIANP